MMLFDLPFDEIPGEKAVQENRSFSYCIFHGIFSKHEPWLTLLKATVKQHSVQFTVLHFRFFSLELWNIFRGRKDHRRSGAGLAGRTQQGCISTM